MSRDPILDQRDKLQARLLDARRQLAADESQLESARSKLVHSKDEVEGIERTLQSMLPLIADAEGRDTAAQAEAAEKRRQAFIEYAYQEQAPHLRATIERFRKTGNVAQAAIWQHELARLRQRLEAEFPPPATSTAARTQ